MTVDKFYRYGIAADKKVFETHPAALDGIVIPAHLACDQPSLSTFVRSLGKQYFVDPMTFGFALPEADMNSANGALKRSYRKLVEAIQWPRAVDFSSGERLEPWDFTQGGPQPTQMVVSFVESVLEVQSRLAKDQKEMKELAKLAKLMAESGEDLEGFNPEAMANEFPPSVLLSPYFFFEGYASPWYEVNVRLYQIASGLAQTAVYPVIAIDSQFLVNGRFDRLIQDFGQAPGFVLWVGDFREAVQSTTQLAQLRKLVKALSGDGARPVISLYAGMFQAFLESDGMTAVSSGLGYSESKASIVAAGGLPAPRYFVPEVFQNLVREDFTPLLKSLGRIACQCVVCHEAKRACDFGRPGWEDRFMFSGFFPQPRAGARSYADGENQWNLRRHFLLCFAQEVRNFGGLAPAAIAKKLRDSHGEIEQANPLYARTRAAHLLRWAEALEFVQAPVPAI